MLMEEVLTNFAQPVDIRHESFIDRRVSSGPKLDVLETRTVCELEGLLRFGRVGFGSHL